MIELTLLTGLSVLLIMAAVPLVTGAFGQIYEAIANALASTGCC